MVVGIRVTKKHEYQECILIHCLQFRPHTANRAQPNLMYLDHPRLYFDALLPILHIGSRPPRDDTDVRYHHPDSEPVDISGNVPVDMNCCLQYEGSSGCIRDWKKRLSLLPKRR